ncbi:undecaprenyl-diphosphatase [Bacillus mesophilus]|uniref:Phosphatase PAP2 family protein n=1 Tax=Bacillus mesophilus TaxID=1808955 RepID=A0A6M0Q312_9BACI|nr:phosphatase PAP2 family protein [Bacillus mesophilus]MBM7659916.1 undecaprenyl-diphosphatase [Bacillus mesophilus]NEY70775.1 phosphatase PAP2 family protein [Bacillus mesophilus]
MEITRKIDTEKKRMIPKLLVATCGNLILFLLLAFTIHTYNGLWIDQPVVNFVQVHITGTGYNLIAFFTNLGDKVVVISVGVLSLFILWWKTRDYMGMITIAVVLAGSNELFQSLKDVFLRERPILDPSIDATGYSFPSGHSTVSMAFYGILLYFILKYMKSSLIKTGVILFFSFYILFMGVSRILLRAHYVSDVLAGFAIGFVYLMICIFVYEKVVERKELNRKNKSELTV